MTRQLIAMARSSPRRRRRRRELWRARVLAARRARAEDALCGGVEAMMRRLRELFPRLDIIVASPRDTAALERILANAESLRRGEIPDPRR